MKRLIQKYLIFISILLIIFLDQTTKFFAKNYLGVPKYINKFLTLDLSFNRGVSWGLFYTNNYIFYNFISILILLILSYLAYYIYNKLINNLSIWPEVIILAGGLSNLIDRVFYEGVVDFILISYNDWYFPNFNIADIFITLGVFIMLGQNIYEER